MANSDTLGQNPDTLQNQFQHLIHQNDVQGVAQERTAVQIQQAIAQQGNQIEVSSLRPAPFQGTGNEDAAR